MFTSALATIHPGDLSDLLGVRAYDTYPVKVDQPYSVTSANELAGELWRLPLELNGSKRSYRTRMASHSRPETVSAKVRRSIFNPC
jgi:hypothetical protein